MQVVVDIDEDTYKDIKNGKIYTSVRDIPQESVAAIAKGIVFPKSHGRLIDADEAIKILKSLGNRDYRREKGTIQEAIKMLSFDEYTPTIIPADEESDIDGKDSN